MSRTKRRKRDNSSAERRQKALVKREPDEGRLDLYALYSSLKSLKFGMGLLAAIAIASAVGTFIEQDGGAQHGAGAYGVLDKLGLTELYHSWWFLCLLSLLVLNVVLCVSSRMRLLMRRPGLLLAHASTVFMAAGAFIGACWGVNGFVTLREGEKKDYFEVKTHGGIRRVPLGFSVGLEDFILERYDTFSNGVVLVKERGRKSIESLPAEVGRIHDVFGDKYSLEVLRIVPDFQMSLDTREITSASDQPNNPAVLVALSQNGTRETRWLFAKHPNIHSPREKLPLEAQYSLGGSSYIKDYKSKLWVEEQEGTRALTRTIEVNDPLVYRGYTFYQSSYDDQNLSWTGLQVVKDPGVPSAYVGFAMLCVGVTVELYSKGRRVPRREAIGKGGM